jgi:xylulokinase
MAYAVMEGVAHLAKKNVDALAACTAPARRVIATGGGANSEPWRQLLADAIGLPVDIPEEKEAACLGAALIGAVAEGLWPDLGTASGAAVKVRKRYTPRNSGACSLRRRQFNALYNAMLSIRDIGLSDATR